MDKLSLREDVRLTPQELRVKQCIESGMSNKEISEEIGCQENTVKEHRKNMARKYREKGYSVIGHNGLFKLFLTGHSTLEPVLPAKNSMLAGHWISRFRFQSLDRNSPPDSPRYRESSQINVEFLKTESGFFTHTGANLCGKRRDSGATYMHSLRFLVKHRMAVGIWDNGNSSDNIGCFQLFIYSDARMMTGHHLGNTSNGVVKSGEWLWIKLEESPDFLVDPERLRTFDALNESIERFLNGQPAPALADLFS